MAKPLLVLALLLAVAAPASAAERQTLTRDRPTATFQGKLGVGATVTYQFWREMFPCAPQDLDCETTPVRLDAPGRLVATATPEPEVPYFFHFRLRLFRSDAAGGIGPEVAVKRIRNGMEHGDLPAGHYLLLVQWEEGVQSYTGRLELTPRADV